MVAFKYMLTDNSKTHTSMKYSMGCKFQVIVWVSMGAKKEKLHPFHSPKRSSLTNLVTYGLKSVQNEKADCTKGHIFKSSQNFLASDLGMLRTKPNTMGLKKKKKKDFASHLIHTCIGTQVCES